jgi:hypothetical protein
LRGGRNAPGARGALPKAAGYATVWRRSTVGSRRKVVICRRVTVVFGLKVEGVVPLETPVTYASVMPGQKAGPTPETSVYGNR